MSSSVAKEFEINSNCKASSGCPELAAAYKACLEGKHAPINPHRQRLLVAANKEAKFSKTKKQVKVLRRPTRKPANPHQ